MKLLFDASVSHKLVRDFASEYAGTTHVRDVGLRGAEDRQIWDYARTHGFVIVSKDTDFRERSYVEDSRRRSSGSTWAMQARRRLERCCEMNAHA